MSQEQYKRLAKDHADSITDVSSFIIRTLFGMCC